MDWASCVRAIMIQVWVDSSAPIPWGLMGVMLIYISMLSTILITMLIPLVRSSGPQSSLDLVLGLWLTLLPSSFSMVVNLVALIGEMLLFQVALVLLEEE